MDFYSGSQAIATWLGGAAVVSSITAWLIRNYRGESQEPRIEIIAKANTDYTVAVVEALKTEITRRLPGAKVMPRYAKRDEDHASFRAILEEAAASKPHAIIAIPPRSIVEADDVASRIVKSNIAIICIDQGLDPEHFHEQGIIPPLLITCDNAGGATKAALLVARSGDVRSVGIITGPPDSEPSNQREAAFVRRALADHLAVSWSVCADDWTIDSAADRLARALKSALPDAIFCCNDRLAMDLREYLDIHHRGHSVRIVGFDGIGTARTMVNAGLLYGTIDQGIQQQAELAIAEVCKVAKARKRYFRGHRSHIMVDSHVVTKRDTAGATPAQKKRGRRTSETLVAADPASAAET